MNFPIDLQDSTRGDYRMPPNRLVRNAEDNMSVESIAYRAVRRIPEVKFREFSTISVVLSSAPVPKPNCCKTHQS